MIIHSGPNSVLGAYCDFSWFGEGMKNDYRRSLSPLLMRIYSAKALGYRCLWLPQPSATGVSRFDQKNQPQKASRYLLGMLLLHDMGLTPTYINLDAVQKYFKAIDTFGGIIDAKFLPYWNNQKFVKWLENKTLLCSVYLKNNTQGGALLCVVNPTSIKQSGVLQLNSVALHADKILQVNDLINTKEIAIVRNKISIEIGPYDYRLFQVK